jgi:beta-galactosidase
VRVRDLPPGIEAVRRDRGETGWVFLFNHGEETRRIPVGDGVDLLSGAPVHGSLELPGGGVAVVRLSDG